MLFDFTVKGTYNKNTFLWNKIKVTFIEIQKLYNIYDDNIY